MSASIPEVEQVKLLQQMADIGERRRRSLAETEAATEALRPLVVAAMKAGADRNRVIGLTGISSSMFYAWLKEAGVAVGKPRGRSGGRRAKQPEKK